MTPQTATKGLIFNIQKFSLNDGPGIRTVVFFKGCPLRCQWCANPESQSGRPELMTAAAGTKKITVGTYQTVPEVLTEILKDKAFYDQSGGGVTFSGGEVLAQADFAIALAQAVKGQGIHLACETTGHAPFDVFKAFMPYFDLMYFDCKHWNPQVHLQGTGVTNDLILKNLRQALAANVPLKIRIPIIPDFNYSLDDAKHFGELFQELGVSEVELLPFHQFGLNKYQQLDRPYRLKDTPQLHGEDLLAFQATLAQYQVTAKINSW